MKKLFTLIALLAMAIGAKAEWVEDYKIDYSTHTGFPFYVMGYVPEWIDGVMTDFGAMYKYVQNTEDAEETSDVIVKTEQGVEYYKIALESAGWHQYFIADNIPTELDGTYTVKAMVKASEACSINVNMGWGWGDGQSASASVAIGNDWEEVEWEYSGIGGTSCNLVAQPGTVAATIEWKWVTVSHNQKEVRPVEWIENITNGDAEKTWAEMGLADTRFNDQENNYKICAWGKEREVNMNDDGGWDPFPATIESEEVDGKVNHYFIVHGKAATTEGDASAWDNQFWIQSPKEWKSGTQLKIKFRYKASKAVTVATQCHKQNPSDYLIWHAIGDIAFTEDWQEFDGTMNIADDMGGTWSIAFQLNQNDKDPIDFYFDDLSWQNMKLDEGLFIAASNSETGIEYDFDNAAEFVYDEEADAMVATVGTVGKQDTWVNEIMISTVRGNDAAFKGATLKPSGDYIGEDAWGNYTEASLAKIKLPAAGVWKVSLDTENKQINILKLEGGEEKEHVAIVTNATEIIVKGKERDDIKDDDHPDGTGAAWDNQFWIVANRTLSAGEETVLKFKYKASKEAKTSTQCHNGPGQYIHWAAIGDVNFTTEWVEFSTDFTIPTQCDGSDNANGYKNDFKSIAFNMAEIKEACDYEIKDVQWYLKADSNDEGKTPENLINETGNSNFYVKEGAGTDPYVFGGDDAVNSIVIKAAPAVKYNLAGQRVNKDYKGIVVTSGKKYLAK